MSKTLVLLACLLLLSSLPPAIFSEGESGNKSDIWVYQDGDPDTLIKAVYSKTGSGIIHQWRYYPEVKRFIFEPVSKFPHKPGKEDYFLWQFIASGYTEVDHNSGSLSDYFDDGAYYWVWIKEQNQIKKCL